MSRSPPRSSTRCCRTRRGLTWLIFLGVYVASYTAGLAANLPGGIGVFDTAMLLGLAALPERTAHRRRDRGVSPVLLRHPAVPRRHPVRRQRDAAARRRPAAPCRPRPRCRRSARWSEPDFAVAAPPARSALCGMMLLCARRPGAAARLLLDRSGLSPRSPVRPASSCRR